MRLPWCLFDQVLLVLSFQPSKPSSLTLRRFRPTQTATVSLAYGRPSILYWQGRSLELVEVKGPWQSSGYWWDSRNWAIEEWDAIVLQPLYALRLCYECASRAWTVAGVYD